MRKSITLLCLFKKYLADYLSIALKQTKAPVNPFKPEFTKCHLHPLQDVNCCGNYLVVDEDDLIWLKI